MKALLSASIAIALVAASAPAAHASFFNSPGGTSQSGYWNAAPQTGLYQPGSIWTIGTPISGGSMMSGGVYFNSNPYPNLNQPVWYTGNQQSFFNQPNSYFPGHATNNWFWNGGGPVPAGTNLPAGPNGAPPTGTVAPSGQGGVLFGSNQGTMFTAPPNNAWFWNGGSAPQQQNPVSFFRI